MSAIAGIYHLNEAPLNPVQITNLMRAFQQFPADCVQTWCSSFIFMGCHAQWITPESVGETLPYYDYERKLTITADAIIDNRDELFNRLQVGLKERKTIPDSQLILLAYHKWGEAVPKLLIGDFSFMIWDEKNRKLFGARDFSGARTLYFYHNQNRFAFSTTIEPLFTLPYIGKKLNEEWLAEYLAIPGMVEAVDTRSTVYKNILQVPPSHSITVADSGVIFSRYSTFEVGEKLKLKSNEEYEEAFREVFAKAVTSRVRTYGNVGSHLSGGLDSGTVVSFAAKALKKENKKLHTFSSIPEEGFMDWTPNYYIPDERPYIKEVVNHVGNIKDFYLDFNGNSPLLEIDNFLNLMEMPYKFFENSYWLRGINEEAQKHGIKVLLNGARGNHSISWGPEKLLFDYYADLFMKLKLGTLYRELDFYCTNFKTGKSIVLPKLAKYAFTDVINTFKRNSNNDIVLPTPINPIFAEKTKVINKLQQYGVDMTGRMPKDLNKHRVNHYNQLYVWNKSGTATTKLSLRYALWDRDPTNDIRVIRFCLSLPEEQYVTGGMGRSIIRRATKNKIPDKVRLNHHARGLQAADTIQRMSPSWGHFLNELQQMTNDPLVADFINLDLIKSLTLKISDNPGPEFVFDNEFRILTRSLIVYRFMKTLNERG